MLKCINAPVMKLASGDTEIWSGGIKKTTHNRSTDTGIISLANIPFENEANEKGKYCKGYQRPFFETQDLPFSHEEIQFILPAPL